MKGPARHAVNQITCGKKSFIPITQRKIGVSEGSKPGFNQVPVLPFSYTILLGCMWIGYAMRNTDTLKKFMQAVVFTPPIRLNRTDFCIEESLDMGLKIIENLFDIKFMFKKINPCKTAKVINKANIKLKTCRGGEGRTPHIGMNKLKWLRRNTRRIIVR